MRRTNLCEHGVIELLNTIIFGATVLDLQKGLTESMLSGAEKEREIILLTWKNSWKVALEIRGFWPENEGKNDFFSADKLHGIHCFWSRVGPRNHPFDLEKLSESGPRNSRFLAGIFVLIVDLVRRN